MINQRESIETAHNEAKSNLAKFIFDPKNRMAFEKILQCKPLTKLVAELNSKQYPKDDFNELESITAEWKNHLVLFALPPEKLLDIIRKGGLEKENLTLIRPLLEEKGVFNTLFKNILQVEDLHERGKLFFVLANSSDMHEREILHFLSSIRSAMNTPLFKQQYLECYRLLKSPSINQSQQPEIEQLLNYQHRRLNTKETNDLVDQQINTTQTILKEWVNVLLKQTLLKLIEAGKKNATSNVARFVFDRNNLEKMAGVLTHFPMNRLLDELNALNVTKEKLDQLDIFSSNQSEYALLFKLPPLVWLKILIEEKIEAQDLTSLIGSDGMGAVSGLLDELNELPDLLDRARTFNYLLHSKNESDDDIAFFFQTLGLPDTNKDSFFRLHHIVHNLEEYTNEEEKNHFETAVPHRSAIECVLGITPPDVPHFSLPDEKRNEIEIKNKKTIDDNNARIRSALRITRECVKMLLNKSKLALDSIQLEKFENAHHALLAKELKAKKPPEQKKISNYNDPFIFFIQDNPELFQDFLGQLRQFHPIQVEEKLNHFDMKPMQEMDDQEDIDLQRAILLSLDSATEETKSSDYSPRSITRVR